MLGDASGALATAHTPAVQTATFQTSACLPQATETKHVRMFEGIVRNSLRASLKLESEAMQAAETFKGVSTSDLVRISRSRSDEGICKLTMSWAASLLMAAQQLNRTLCRATSWRLLRQAGSANALVPTGMHT